MTDPRVDERDQLAWLARHTDALASADAQQAAAALDGLLQLARRGTPPVIERTLAVLRDPPAEPPDPVVRDRLAAAAARLLAMPRSAQPRAVTPPPRLHVSTMQPGARYRVVQDFADFDGTPFTAGTVLTFVAYSYFPYDGGYTITFEEGGMRLAEIDTDNRRVLDNSSNTYFAPADDAGV